MARIQSLQIKIFLLLIFFNFSTKAQEGLFYTQEEINVWQSRAGLTSGNKMYNTSGDVSNNSPASWSKVLSNANSFLSNPTSEVWNGDFSNEPYTKGIGMRDAAFVYLLTKNTKYLSAVKSFLITQASQSGTQFKNWSYFGDTKGFHEGDWISRLFYGYMYVRGDLDSSTQSTLDTWFKSAATFYAGNIHNDIQLMFPNRLSNDYSKKGNVAESGAMQSSYAYMDASGNWKNKLSWVSAWYNNRRFTQLRIVGLAGAFFDDANLILHAKTFVKEWLKYSVFPDGTLGEYQRNGNYGNPQNGMIYGSINTQVSIEIADLLARGGDFSLYDYTTSEGLHGTEGGSKSIYLTIKTYYNHIDGTIKRYYGSVSETNRLDQISPAGTHWINDVWFAKANIYYQDEYFAKVYTRTASGVANYPSSGIGTAGPIRWAWGGSGAVFPCSLFMYGQLEGKIWPYSSSDSKPTNTKILYVESELNFGDVILGETQNKNITIENNGNTELTITSISSDNSQFKTSYSGTIQAGGSVVVSVAFTPTSTGEQSATMAISSDKTSGSNTVTLSGTGTIDNSDNTDETYVSTIYEAETTEYEVLTESGSNGSVVAASDKSTYLSDETALQLYDKGDKVRYTFDLKETGTYQIKIRLRSGNVINTSAYLPNGYSYSLDNASINMSTISSETSSKDVNFGISYWGTVQSEKLLLDEGKHTLDIESLMDWALIDYIEILQFGVEEQEPIALDIANAIDFGNVIVSSSSSKEVEITNNGEISVEITSIESDSEIFTSNFSGTIEAGETALVEVNFSPTALGLSEATLTIVSNDATGEIKVSGTGVKESASSDYYSNKIEAEDEFTVDTETGSFGDVSVSEDTSPELSGNKAVQIYDLGDVVSIPFDVPYDGKYTIKVRLRSGNRSKNYVYLNSGYSFKINGVDTDFNADEESISDLDQNFGISYWGTMYTEGLTLEEGVNVLTIKAEMSWGVVDYIEVIGEDALEATLETPDALDFGDVSVGTTITKSIVVENNGKATFTIDKTDITGEFSGSWSGEVKSGETTEISIDFTPEGIGDYEGEFVIYSDGYVYKTIKLTASGVVEELYSVRLEAEEHYEVVKNKGSNGAITVADEESTILSNNKAVQLYDKGDIMKITFDVPKSSNYIITVRLRAGNYLNSSVYLPDGYSFYLDNEDISFTTIEDSISALVDNFGKSTFGTVESDELVLEEGTHELEIESAISWALVDYIEITEVDNSKERNSNDSSDLLAGNLSVSVDVYPNPVTDYLNVSMDTEVEGSGKIVLMDAFGKVVYENDITSYDSKQSIDVTRIDRGLYLLQVQLGGQKNVKRVFIE
ncbi:choice-of-anchor D domain-containing protein [Chondrinema litorale]|uniref:choice-of-anchor D domain-containing protein n=1 Tax=Chondrinema litorale TaxID=2994555 RepID=UPI002542978B|nr:choice-of-anchor D domain-containing protein [Chondrinema litorale]UZR93209.1 choice-of-anchor D domain-containing protein [Chondrinema litorale]